MGRKLEAYFEFAALATWRTEILAGSPPFMTIAYIDLHFCHSRKCRKQDTL